MTDFMIESFPSTVVAGMGQPRHCVSVASADPTILTHILRPEVHLAIWHRDTSAFLGGMTLRRLMKAAPFAVITESRADDIAEHLSEQLPAAAPFDLLLDLTDLALSFAAINDAVDDPIRIRLDGHHRADCSGWRAEMGLRMLCTYCGPGIEWLFCADGALLAEAVNGCDAPHASLQLTTSAVAILKGDDYPGNRGNGCIHRSPRITPVTGARLQVCIDQPSRSPLS